MGHAAGSRRDAGELELAEEVVVLGPRALTLVHLDQDARLVAGVGGEDLLLLGRDEDRHDPTCSLQAERQRRDVEQEQVSCTFLLPSPLRMAAWTAAPYATASSVLLQRDIDKNSYISVECDI